MSVYIGCSNGTRCRPARSQLFAIANGNCGDSGVNRGRMKDAQLLLEIINSRCDTLQFYYLRRPIGSQYNFEGDKDGARY